MTDRRSHWDDDLVDGVGRRLIPLYRSIGYCTDAERHRIYARIYALIEFVEDWQDRTQQARAMSITDNKAAIARVRELADAAIAAHDGLEGTYATVSAKALLNALEVDNDG